MSALRKAKTCEVCRQRMDAGTDVKWVECLVMSRDGAGRRHDRTIRVPAHAFDCGAAMLAAQRAERAA